MGSGHVCACAISAPGMIGAGDVCAWCEDWGDMHARDNHIDRESHIKF
jgi:hypothetical protein